MTCGGVAEVELSAVERLTGDEFAGAAIHIVAREGHAEGVVDDGDVVILIHDVDGQGVGQRGVVILRDVERGNVSAVERVDGADMCAVGGESPSVHA